MSFRNIVTWNPVLQARVLGYDVSNGSTTVRVVSNAYADATLFATEDLARAVIYSVTTVFDTVEGFPPDTVLGSPDSVTLVQSRWSFDTSEVDFCVLTGRITAASGVLRDLPEVRVSVAHLDMPMLVPSFGYLSGDEVVFRANCRGEFAVPLVRQCRILLHIPAVHLQGLIIVPDVTTVDLRAVSVEPADVRRNS